MVDVTVPLAHFCGSLGLCLIAWNPLIPIVIELLALIAITRDVTPELVLTRLAAGLYAMYIMRRNPNVEKTSNVMIFIQSLVYINVRMGAITLIQSVAIYMYPIPAYMALNLVMAYPFFFEQSKCKWESYLSITLGYNFLFAALKYQLTLELQLILLIAPPLFVMVAKDLFPKTLKFL